MLVWLFFGVCAGKKVKLSLAAEEVALFFAQMLDHEYTTKTVFRENFFKDWRKVKRESVIDFARFGRKKHFQLTPLS